MEDLILEEVNRDVFERPKSTIDLDYLYSVKRQVEEFADETNSQLKKNVYQNYSLFIESSREISTLKEEMRQLSGLLEEQQTSMNKLLEHLNERPIIQPTLDQPKATPFRLELNEDTSEVEAEMLPGWFTKSPEDFDVLIAQRNLREAVELAKAIEKHFEQYPKCCDNKQAELKSRIERRVAELIAAICSELQPATNRSVQGGPRSSVSSIQLLRELKLSARAVKLYLDQRSSLLHFVLDQQKLESTTSVQFIKQICSIFFHNIIETCNEFKQAFEVDKYVAQAIDDSAEELGIQIERQDSEQMLLSDLVKPIYSSIKLRYPSSGSSQKFNGTDISPSRNQEDKIDLPFPPTKQTVFRNLSTYSSLTYWITQEFENFIVLFRDHVFNNPQMSLSMITESIYHLRNKCSKTAVHCEIDLSEDIEEYLKVEIEHMIKESKIKLEETIKKLESEETWAPQQFQNKAQLTRFFEEMKDVDLNSMPKYIFEDLKLRFTACTTSFSRYFLITVSDLAKIISPSNQSQVDEVLWEAFEKEMECLESALKREKQSSKKRFIMGNSNFLLDKVIPVANTQYTATTGFQCRRLDADWCSRWKERVRVAARLDRAPDLH